MIKIRTFFSFLPNNCKHTANKPTYVCVLASTAEVDLTSNRTPEGDIVLVVVKYDKNKIITIIISILILTIMMIITLISD